MSGSRSRVGVGLGKFGSSRRVLAIFPARLNQRREGLGCSIYGAHGGHFSVPWTWLRRDFSLFLRIGDSKASSQLVSEIIDRGRCLARCRAAG